MYPPIDEPLPRSLSPRVRHNEASWASERDRRSFAEEAARPGWGRQTCRVCAHRSAASTRSAASEVGRCSRESNGDPAGSVECYVLLPVALDIACEFRCPIALVAARGTSMLWAAMPEAPIHEHRNPRPREHDVGAGRGTRNVDPKILAKPQPSLVQLRSEAQFGLRVSPPVRSHRPARVLSRHFYEVAVSPWSRATWRCEPIDTGHTGNLRRNGRTSRARHPRRRPTSWSGAPWPCKRCGSCGELRGRRRTGTRGCRSRSSSHGADRPGASQARHRTYGATPNKWRRSSDPRGTICM